MKALREALRFGMMLAVSLLTAVLAGLGLDRLLHTTPVFLVLLILYAIGGSIWRLYKKMEEET